MRKQTHELRMSTKRINHIYWFAYYNLDSPSVRYRAKYPLDYAREQLSISSRLVVPGYSPKRVKNFLAGYFPALLFPKKNSVIVIQRVQSNFLYANLLKLLVLARGKTTVYDLDDADYLEFNPKTIHFFARKCSYISAGSPAIAEYLHTFNRQVSHTTSPTPDLGIIKDKRSPVFNIGWIGGFGGGHKESLYQYLFPALKELKFNCKLTMLGVTSEIEKAKLTNYLEGHDHIELDFPSGIDWNEEAVIQQWIAQFDVGIATLQDHPVQLAKSGIKAKQYMNNGVPVICNNLPENKNVVVDGFNGFICDSASEFAEKLTALRNMEDADYWKLSNNARASIENFDHRKYFEDLEALISH